MTLKNIASGTMLPLLLALPLALACGDKDDDTGPAGDGGAGDGGSDGGSDGGGDGGADGFTVTGVAVDFGTLEPMGEGLCVHALDPTTALAGGEIQIVASSTVGAGGAYTVENVVMDSTVGMFVLIADCADEGTVMSSATGVSVASYQTLGAGDTLDTTALVVTTEGLAGLSASLGAVGETADLGAEGGMFAFLNDSAGVGVSDATITCSTCGSSYYFDTDPADGLFSTGTRPNDASDAAAGGLSLIVGAPVASYSITQEGGALTWDDTLFGSLPGLAVFAAFYAN